MSAYIVHPATVQLLVAAADDRMVARMLRDAYDTTAEHEDPRGAAVRYLACMNVRSVQYRYGGESVETLPGYGYSSWLPGMVYQPCPDVDAGRVSVHRFTDGTMSDDVARRVLGALHCYAYQSCELPEWQLTPARAFVSALESRLAGQLAVGWEYDGAVSVTADALACAS